MCDCVSFGLKFTNNVRNLFSFDMLYNVHLNDFDYLVDK